MPHPHWISDLRDFWTWAEEVLDSAGGILTDADYLQVELFTAAEDDPMSAALLLDIDRQRIEFSDGSYLSFEMSIDADLEYIHYSYHYARVDDAIVWRHDKHDGHEAVDGTDTHVHLPGKIRRASKEVTVDEIIDLIRDDQAQRR